MVGALVGDSTEGDGILYAEIQQEFPDRVLQVLIRDTGQQKYLAGVLEGLSAKERRKWQVFTESSEIRMDFIKGKSAL